MQSAKFLLTAVVSLAMVACNNEDTPAQGQASPEPESKTETVRTDDSVKPASDATRKANQALLDYLDFDDPTDAENARRGFIATLPEGVITDEDGNEVYNMKQYDFIKGEAPDTTNPSLWRQSELNSLHGLFKVTDGIYQVRNFDLSNITFVKGKTGWIVIDPLISPPPVKAAMALLKEHVADLPVKAVIFTHSHIDHFGGIRGLVTDEQVASGEVQLYAPKGFFEHSVSEMVMAGNTMSRRASYMYGNVLPKSPEGTLGTGLGQTTSTGLPGIIEPTHIVSSLEGETHEIDGIPVEFIYTPESEAPAEMMFYFPTYKAFCQAEDINHTLHNLYTLRGAQVRNGQKWSKYIDHAIAKWGDDAEFSFGTHHWPTWGNDNIVPYWEKQRDLYRFIHDQTLRMANQGMTPREIAEELTLPESLDKEFYNRGYYGSVSHDIKAQYQLYFGWFDGNPANLNPLPPADAGKKYVEFMGGADAVMDKAQGSIDNGEYRWAAEVLNHVVFADPSNQAARNMLADAYEQMGYQAESGPWRNFYLSGANELRHGVQELPTPQTSSPDLVGGLTTELYFDYLAMRFKGADPEAAKLKKTFNIKLEDAGEELILIVSNGAVTPRIGEQVDDADATVTLNRADLNQISLGLASFDSLEEDDKISIDGDAESFNQFVSYIDTFKFWFNIVEP